MYPGEGYLCGSRVSWRGRIYPLQYRPLLWLVHTLLEYFLFTLQIHVVRDIHLCFNIFLTISFILTLIGEPRLYVHLVHSLLLWTPLKSGFCLVMKFFAKITVKNFDQIQSKIKEFVIKVWENLSVDDYRSDDGQGSREDSLRKPENEASADERNCEERDVINDNDDNDGVDVGASCANETKVGENNENDDCKPNGEPKRLLQRFARNLVNSCVFMKTPHFVGSF